MDSGGRRLLIVDDSATMRRMVSVSLRAVPGLSLPEAGNGLEAIEKLALGKVDLIILDLNMPDMHGLEVVQFVRRHAVHGSTPILILTTRGDEESRSTLSSAGATRYLTKPFQPDVLAGHVRELLDLA